MTMRALVIASLLATAAAAAAQTSVGPSSVRDPDYATRKICRVSPANGSRLGGTRTCRTRAQWDEFARDSRNIVEHIQRVSPPCLMGPNAPGQAHLACSN